jgi:beta-glucosidase
MFLQFPDKFIWGTSTAAYQIETAGEHTWKGFKSIDGSTFDKCSMHDLHRDEDLEYICQLAPSYRMSMDWSKLQKAPYADFDEKAVADYKNFLDKLKARGETIMLVMHHFTNPLWFEDNGGWESDDGIAMFLDFAKKTVEIFGHYADLWNTFNEPMVYISNGWLMGNFPPFLKGRLLKARRVLKRIATAHDQSYDIIKSKFPDVPVGISKNTVKFVGEVFPGHILAWVFDKWFMEYGGDHFTKVDFTGMSYYARMPFRPLPVTEIDNPGKLAKLGRRHDMMWEYMPEEFYHILHRFWKRYQKPIIITESGICTHDPQERIESIREYLFWIHKAIQDGIPIQGYYHWSTMDNHEWNIGLNFRFGLVRVNFDTGERSMTEAGTFYAELTRKNGVEIEKPYA